MSILTARESLRKGNVPSQGVQNQPSINLMPVTNGLGKFQEALLSCMKQSSSTPANVLNMVLGASFLTVIRSSYLDPDGM